MAFFKKGKLTVEPRRPDSRTYVKITTADDAGAAINPPRSSQLIGSTLGVKCHVKTAAVTGIPRVSATRAESVAIPAHANRGGAQSERGPRQSGLSDYWDSRRSPGNKERPTSPL